MQEDREEREVEAEGGNANGNAGMKNVRSIINVYGGLG